MSRATKKARQPPTKFIFDENISVHIVAGMREFGENVQHLTEHFAQGTADEDWLVEVGKRGWFLVTRDRKIRRRPAQLDALRRNAVGAFFLGGKDLDRCRQITQLVRAWPRIKQHAQREVRPFAFNVNQSGTKLGRVNLPKLSRNRSVS